MKVFLFLLLALCVLEHKAHALVRGQQKKETLPSSRILKGGMDKDSGDGGDGDDPTDEIVDAITEAACFSAVAMVQVENQGPVAMKDLQVGDKILTGNNQYEPVYSFGHWEPNANGNFLQFVTEESTLEMTGEHLVFLANKATPVPAASIQVGDVLLPAAKVTQINSIQREGLYAPLTQAGNLVVDGVVASSYISLQNKAEFVQVDSVTLGMSQHTFAHIAMSPFRMMCMGASSQFCENYSSNGIQQYVAGGIAFKEWGESQNVVVQWLVFSAALLALCFSMTLENIFGATLAPAAVVAMGAVYAFFKATGLSVRKAKTA